MKWLKITVLVLVLGMALPLAVLPSTPAMAATNADVTVKATPAEPYPAPTNFQAIYVDVQQVDLTWTKPPTSANVTIRAKYGSYPASRTDGYLVYYGSLESISDTSMNFDETAGKLYYRAWAEYPGDNWSNPAEDNVEGIAMTLIGLAILALGLTVAMFHSKSAMLGFPCLIFWAILGGFAYTESSTPWGDWQYYLFFGSFGMAIFSAFAAYGLRTKKEELAEGDEFIDEGKDDVKFIDEGGQKDMDDNGEKPRRISRSIRERAERRRARWD